MAVPSRSEKRSFALSRNGDDVPGDRRPAGCRLRTVNRVLARYRRPSGSSRCQGVAGAVPDPGPYCRPLEQIVTAMSDATVEELTTAFRREPSDQSVGGATGSASSRLLAKKKSFVASERDTPDGGVSSRILHVPYEDERQAARLHRRVVLQDRDVPRACVVDAWRRARGQRPGRSWKTVSLSAPSGFASAEA